MNRRISFFGTLISVIFLTLAGCAYNSKTIGGVEIPMTAAGVCEAFYNTAQVGAEEEPSVARVEARYGGYFRVLNILVYYKDGEKRENSYFSGQLPSSTPSFVDEHMPPPNSFGVRIPDVVVVTCSGRHGPISVLR